MFLLVLADPGSPRQRAVKRLCVCVCCVGDSGFVTFLKVYVCISVSNCTALYCYCWQEKDAAISRAVEDAVRLQRDRATDERVRRCLMWFFVSVKIPFLLSVLCRIICFVHFLDLLPCHGNCCMLMTWQ